MNSSTSLAELWDVEDQFSALAGSAIGSVQSITPGERQLQLNKADIASNVIVARSTGRVRITKGRELHTMVIEDPRRVNVSRYIFAANWRILVRNGDLIEIGDPVAYKCEPLMLKSSLTTRVVGKHQKQATRTSVATTPVTQREKARKKQRRMRRIAAQRSRGQKTSA